MSCTWFEGSLGVDIVMCSLDSKVLSDVRRIVCDGEYVPTKPQELCGRLFVTCYMGSENSSQETKMRAFSLAEQIGR
jgi:NAD+ synthase (glutamine-hydrolysing)